MKKTGKFQVICVLASAWMTCAVQTTRGGTDWEHWQFSGDMAFLRNRAYPAMKEAAEFFLDYLVEIPPGELFRVSTR